MTSRSHQTRRDGHGLLADMGASPLLIEKGRPQQNGFVERFNWLMRNELLNAEVFHSMTEVHLLTREWVKHYNTQRPHGALEHVPLSVYRSHWKGTSQGWGN